MFSNWPPINFAVYFENSKAFLELFVQYLDPIKGLSHAQGPEVRFTQKICHSGFCMLDLYFGLWGIQKRLSELIPQ